MLGEGKPSWDSAEGQALHPSPWQEPGRKWQWRLNQAFDRGSAAPHRDGGEVVIARERQERQEMRGWLRAWPFMAEAAIPIQSFKTFYITGYFCGSKW